MFDFIAESTLLSNDAYMLLVQSCGVNIIIIITIQQAQPQNQHGPRYSQEVTKTMKALLLSLCSATLLTKS